MRLKRCAQGPQRLWRETARLRMLQDPLEEDEGNELLYGSEIQGLNGQGSDGRQYSAHRLQTAGRTTLLLHRNGAERSALAWARLLQGVEPRVERSRET
eukprot:5728775-Prymnesium_polylepis.1